MKMSKRNKIKWVSFFEDKWYIDAYLQVKPFEISGGSGRCNFIYNNLNCFNSYDDAIYVVERIKYVLSGANFPTKIMNDENIIFFIREDLRIDYRKIDDYKYYNMDNLKEVGNYFVTHTIAEIVLDTIKDIFATSRTSKHPYSLLNHLRFWFSTFRFKLPR